MPSSFLMRSMAADLSTLETVQIALSISICMDLRLAFLMPNVSPPTFSTSYCLKNLCRYIPLAIHNAAQVGVLVGGFDFLALQGHISSQLPAYRNYPALGGIHSHFPSVRPFSNGFQCGL
ncbi:hypothetical protein AYI70_g6539 [Smittium culicis]|uniref:Uncharacterized protein n=1 Tax=Smittium culicis TaxID=133412 RepID=A0A1R1XPH5_9FUNG|nr:hypothetical protein AYI70_g6539 [Smittium culicis]